MCYGRGVRHPAAFRTDGLRTFLDLIEKGKGKERRKDLEKNAAEFSHKLIEERFPRDLSKEKEPR